MKSDHPGRLFVERFGLPQSGKDVMRYVGFLRKEAGLTTAPPIDLEPIRQRFDITFKFAPLLKDIQAMLFDPERGLILVNENDIPTRQRFSQAHELIEYLFDGLPQSGAANRAGVFTREVKERLCNQGAAELLMPHTSFVPRLRRLGVSYLTGRALALEYNVSTVAALTHTTRIGPGHHAIVLWRMKNKPTEVKNRVSEGQLALFGDMPTEMFPKKLRVEWSFTKDDALYIPSHKSVPDDSSIFAAWRDGVFGIGEDHLDLGTIQGKFKCENQPFVVEDETLVFSLLHLPGDTA